MRKFVTTVVAVGAISAFSAASAFAAPINPINTRPISPVNAGDGPGMQTILDSVYGCTGCVDAITGQSAAGMWELPGGDPVITAPILKFEFAGDAGTNTFGIWSGTDTTAITTAQIFSGPAGPGSIATLVWTTPTSLSINGGAPVAINQYGFGFYIGTAAGNFYSVDQLNPGGSAQMLAYVNPSSDRWVFGFEDRVGGDNDFNDMVVSTESITPVPEPGSMMLFGTGLFGLGGAIRRRLAKRA